MSALRDCSGAAGRSDPTRPPANPPPRNAQASDVGGGSTNQCRGRIDVGPVRFQHLPRMAGEQHVLVCCEITWLRPTLGMISHVFRENALSRLREDRFAHARWAWQQVPRHGMVVPPRFVARKPSNKGSSTTPKSGLCAKLYIEHCSCGGRTKKKQSCRLPNDRYAACVAPWHHLVHRLNFQTVHDWPSRTKWAPPWC